jgi:hypothetical protein
MARLPDVTDFGDRPTTTSNRAIATNRSGLILGEAFEDVSTAVREVADRREAFDLATAESSLLVGLEVAKREAAQEKDWQRIEPRFRESAAKHIDTVSKGLSRRSRVALEDRAALIVERGATSMLDVAREKEIDVGRATLAELLVTNKQAYLAAIDPAERDAIAYAASHAVIAARDAGIIDAESAFKTRQGFAVDLVEGDLAQRSPAERIQLLTSSTDVRKMLAPERRAILLDAAHTDLKADVVEGSARDVMAAYEAYGMQAGIDALVAAEKEVPPQLVDDVRAQVNARVSQFRQVRREQRAQDIAGVESQIATQRADSTTRSAVDDLFESGALTPSEYANYHGQIDAGVIKRAKTDAALTAIGDALERGLPLDPRDKDHREALSAAFQAQTVGENVGSSTWRATAQAYAQRARMLPDQAIAWTRASLRSPDPAIASSAASFYGALQATAPDATAEFDTDTRAFAATVNSMMEAGTSPERAVETARATVLEARPELIEQRQTQYRQHTKSSAGALSSLIDKDFDPGLFGAQPAASAALSVDFDAQASRYFAKVGDIGLARDLAWQDLKRVYGPSRVNGDATVIAFPPERFGVEPTEIRNELGNFLKGSPQADGSAAADILVVPDALTLRAVSDALSGEAVRPSYKLVTKTGDLVLDRDGIPLRYTIPSSDELGQRYRTARAAAEADAQRRVMEAKAERDAREEQARRFVESQRVGVRPHRGGLD